MMTRVDLARDGDGASSLCRFVSIETNQFSRVLVVNQILKCISSKRSSTHLLHSGQVSTLAASISILSTCAENPGLAFT